MIDHNAFSWTSLRTIGNSKIARLSYLFPVFGYFILFNNFVIDIARSNFSWREIDDGFNYTGIAFYYYFGFLLFSIGSIIFLVACPNIIKKYDDEEYFIKDTRDNFTEFDFVKYCTEMSVSKEYAENSKKMLAVVKSAGLSSVDSRSIIQTRKMYFTFLSKKSNLARFFCFAAYFSGFIFIFVPTADGILSVLKAVLYK